MARTGIYGGQCITRHTAYIMDRGGKHRIAQLVDISQIRWDRRRDETSEALVIIRGSACSAQAEMLSNIEPKRHELVIYRGDERVWEGPIGRVGWHSDWVEVAARDVTDYLYHRPLSKIWDNSYPNVTTVTGRMQEIIEYELSNPFIYRDDDGSPVVVAGWEEIDPPANVLPFLQAHQYPNEARTSAKTTPFQMTIGEHLDNYARTGGIDYTVVGRAIHIWDVSRQLGQTRTVTEADFFGEVIVTAYGADHASVAFTVADDGRYGGAGGSPSSWRWMEKSGPAGSSVTTFGTAPRRPSVLDFETRAWEGYRYWMIYQPDNTSAMRLVASKDGTTWVDVAEKNIDAEVGDAATEGDFPALAYAYSDHLWAFWVGSNGHLYRSRTENGRDWTVKIDLWTPTGGIVMRSPSLFYNPNSQRWTLFAVDDATDRLFWMTSTTRELDDTGQWGAVTYATIDTNPAINTVEMRYIGARWVGVCLTGSGIRIIESKTPQASSGFKLSGVVAPNSGKPTWVQTISGDLDMWYEDNPIMRTTLTGPAPVPTTTDPGIEYYGPWTKVFTVYDEDETAAPTQADLNSQARLNLSGRSPVPVEVRVPDSSSIRLSPGIGFEQLVPGVNFPLRATLNARTLSQMQKLDHVVISENPEGETIQVTFVPATKRDSDEEEGA